MTIHDDVLTVMKPTSYKAVRDEVRDGDILLCSATDPMSRLIRWATGSQWSHIGIAYRLNEIDRVMVLEAVAKIGVRAVPLSTFIARTSGGIHPYPGHILLARHQGMGAKSRSNPMKKMAGFAFDRLGDPFSNREMVKIVLRIIAHKLGRKLPRMLVPDKEFICSEYVAGCYERLDLKAPWDGLGFIAPSDFAKDARVDAVALIKTR
ncbi:MAG: hypothetical protein JWP35_546 [Caulobacter sp.]|nr:hypothetical protein [Caulobacter sp.]